LPFFLAIPGLLQEVALARPNLGIPKILWLANVLCITVWTTLWITGLATESAALNTARQLKEDGFRLVTRPIAIACFDPAGEGRDHAALTVQQREEWQCGEPDEPRFAVTMISRLLHAERMPPAQEMPENMARLIRLARVLKEDPFFLNWRLGIELNGIGVNYAQLLRRRLPLAHVVGYTVVAKTIGDKAAGAAGWVMPRQAGLDHFRAALETQVFKLSRKTVGAKDFVGEMRTMVWKGTRPEALQGSHDDLVMSAAGGYWIATKILPSTVRTQQPGRKAA
jgi:hypothetical protein